MSRNQQLQDAFKAEKQVEVLQVAVEDNSQVNITMLAILLLIFLIGGCSGYLSHECLVMT